MKYSNVTRPLWKHQLAMNAWTRNALAEHQYALELAGCAVGKTLAALDIATEYHNVLVLTVKGAITSAWEADTTNWTDGVRFITPLTGSVPERLQKIKDTVLTPFEGTTIVAINYEAAYMMRYELEKLPFGLVISDETHKLKTYNSKTSQWLAMAFRNVPHHLSMTGTAFNDKPIDLYGIFRFFQPIKYPSPRAIIGSRLFGQWGQFFDTYANYYMLDKIKIPTSYKNLPQLAALVDPHTFYLNTEDVFSRTRVDAEVVLPDVNHIDIYVKMTPEMRRAYKDMVNEMVVKFGERLMVADCQLAQATRLHQLTSGVWTDTEEKELFSLAGDNPKVDAVLDIIDSLGHAPVVIFTRFKSDVRELEKALDKVGVSHLKLVGGTYEHDRWSKGEAQVLITNMSAGSTGVNLQRANHAIYMSTGSSATEYDQSVWRIRRPAGDLLTGKTMYHIMVDESVDIAIRKMLDKKASTTELLLNELKGRL